MSIRAEVEADRSVQIRQYHSPDRFCDRGEALDIPSGLPWFHPFCGFVIQSPLPFSEFGATTRVNEERFIPFLPVPRVFQVPAISDKICWGKWSWPTTPLEGAGEIDVVVTPDVVGSDVDVCSGDSERDCEVA